MAEGSTLGLLSFLSFAFSIIAAVLAIDMYTLLRTGQFGNSWRVMIIASVIFALVQVLRLAELLNFETFQVYALSQVVELVFVMALAYAFYLQRKAFALADRQFKSAAELEENDDIPEEAETDWDEFATNYHEGDALLSDTDEAEERYTKLPAPHSPSSSHTHSSLTTSNRPR